MDSAEKYPWRFAGATVERRKLRAGDYALIEDGRVSAVVERKTFDNMLADLGAVQALHHQLADLASHERAALVVEAQFGDFLDPARPCSGRGRAARWSAGRASGDPRAAHAAERVSRPR